MLKDSHRGEWDYEKARGCGCLLVFRCSVRTILCLECSCQIIWDSFIQEGCTVMQRSGLSLIFHRKAGFSLSTCEQTSPLYGVFIEFLLGALKDLVL